MRRSVSDDGDGPVKAVAEAAEIGAHVVVFSGGVSAGAYEVVKNTMADSMEFVKVAMQPGKPQGFGVHDGVLLFGLPGNPVSALVSFHVFVLPMLRVLAGRPATNDEVEAVAGADWSTAPGKVEFTRVVLTDGVASPSRGQGSHMLAALATANALAVVPEDVVDVRAGDRVRCVRLLGAEG